MTPIHGGVQMALQGKTRRRGPLSGPLAAAVFALSLGACESLLEVDLPGNLTEDALRDPALAEVLVTSVVGDFECGFVDYMRFPGQWFEESQNSSQSRPDALSGLRSQLVGVYADPCSSGTGPIWTTIQVPRQNARRAVEFIRAMTFSATNLPDTTFLIAKARLYEAYSIQLLAEQFCAVTFDAGPLVTRVAAYDSAEVKFTEAITKGLLVTGARAVEAAAVVNAARVGRARSRLYQWQYSGGLAADVIADASLVSANFQMNATYDANPARRRNRIFDTQTAKSMMPHRDWTNLRIAPNGTHVQGAAGGVLDPRVRITVATSSTDVDGRGVGFMRRQTKFPARTSPIPFATWREARLMIAEVDPTQTLAIINQLRTTTTGMAATINTAGTAGASAFPLPTISAVDWAAMTPAQQQTTLWEERRRELYLQGTQAGDKIRWAYPAWDNNDEYGGSLRDVTQIDDPLTTGPEVAQGCIPIPALERGSNPFLIELLGG
jgi:hypothetical protein